MFGSFVRAMPTTPRANGVSVNSAGKVGQLRAARPVPVGSPVWAMKPSITRWKTIAVIEALAGQRLQALDVLGREVRSQRDGHRAVLQFQDERVFRVGRLGRSRDDQVIQNAARAAASVASFMEIPLCRAKGRPLRPQRRVERCRCKATTGGTNGSMSPPMPAIWRTSVAVMWRASGLAGRNTVCSQGAIVPFIPAICIS